MRLMMSAAAAVMLIGSAANAATVTFTGLPDEGAQLTSWVEDGVTATAQGGTLAFEGGAGTAHLDDFGTGFTSSLAFSTGGLFAATSFDILPSSNEYELCTDLGEGEVDCDPSYSFANVAVTGYADGTVVASDAFDMFAVNGTYSFSDALAGLDLLVIGFAAPPTDLPDGLFLFCDDAPCTHYSVDNVTLTPAAVPLPASGVLLAFGLIGLAGAYHMRR